MPSTAAYIALYFTAKQDEKADTSKAEISTSIAFVLGKEARQANATVLLGCALSKGLTHNVSL